MVFAKLEDLEMWPKHRNKVQKFLHVIISNGCLDLSANILISVMVLVRDVQQATVASHLKGLHSFLYPAVKVTDSQT